jgi:hypothetical protein
LLLLLLHAELLLLHPAPPVGMELLSGHGEQRRRWGRECGIEGTEEEGRRKRTAAHTVHRTCVCVPWSCECVCLWTTALCSVADVICAAFAPSEQRRAEQSRAERAQRSSRQGKEGTDNTHRGGMRRSRCAHFPCLWLPSRSLPAGGSVSAVADSCWAGLGQRLEQVQSLAHT